MQYRKLGRTELDVSEIGMGLEHLLDKDEAVVAETIQTAIRGGVNYFDCLPLSEYSTETGENEAYLKLGRALEGCREWVYLTFLAYVSRPLPYIQADFACYLRALRTDHTDVFILACCDRLVDFEQATGAGSLLEYAKKLRGEGKVRHIGFSTHNAELAHRVIRSGDFDVLMFPVNPAFDVIPDEERFHSDILGNIWDAAYQFTSADGGPRPRTSVYDACERYGVGLVAMKPFAGGFIFGVEKAAGFTPLNLLSYALAQAGVSTVVPGCANPREIEQILAYHSAPAEALDYSGAVAKSRWSVRGNCLYCSHCQPCAVRIDIAAVNRLLDSARAGASADMRGMRERYAALAVKPSACVRCGACEERCPFQVGVMDQMKQAAEAFENALP